LNLARLMSKCLNTYQKLLVIGFGRDHISKRLHECSLPIAAVVPSAMYSTGVTQPAHCCSCTVSNIQNRCNTACLLLLLYCQQCTVPAYTQPADCCSCTVSNVQYRCNTACLLLLLYCQQCTVPAYTQPAHCCSCTVSNVQHWHNILWCLCSETFYLFVYISVFENVWC